MVCLLMGLIFFFFLPSWIVNTWFWASGGLSMTEQEKVTKSVNESEDLTAAEYVVRCFTDVSLCRFLFNFVNSVIL